MRHHLRWERVVLGQIPVGVCQGFEEAVERREQPPCHLRSRLCHVVRAHAGEGPRHRALDVLPHAADRRPQATRRCHMLDAETADEVDASS